MASETITWISVADDLPDDDIVCMIFTKAEIEVWIGCIVDRTPGCLLWRSVEGWPMYDVTHWAEMPAGPKSE